MFYMVRLTDLVGTSDRKKKQGSPADSPISRKRQPAGESRGFLQASDLASIYDIPDQAESPEESQDTLSRETSQAVPLEESPAVEQVPQQQPGTDQPIPGQTEDSYEQESVGEMPPESTPESGETVPKQPLPGTLAYHQEKGRQKASISDERRFFEEADAIHIELLDLIDDVYTDGRESRVPRVERFIEPLMRLITVCRNSNVILRKAVRLKKGGETLTTHSLNVAILSIKIGISRGYSQEKLFSFALCALLGDIGYRVDCVSPSSVLTEHAHNILADKSQIFECSFEKLQTEKRYDVILFSESFQYVNLEKAIQNSIKFLNDNGYLLICDFFRTDAEGKSNIGGGHELIRFYDIISQYPLKLVKDIDITKETAPNLDIVNEFLTNVGLPIWNLFEI